MSRLVGLIVTVMVTGCAAPMATMQPVKRTGLDVVYQNGVPVTLSRGSRSSVIVAPVTTGSGRYPVRDRIAFLVFVRNDSPERVEIAEASFSLTANETRARTMTAVEVEDAIRGDASWAHAANGFSAMVSGLGLSRAAAGPSSNGATGSVFAPGAREGQGAHGETARYDGDAAAALAAREAWVACGLCRILQRNTVLPGQEVGGFVVMDVPRDPACVRIDRLSTGVDGEPGGGIRKVAIPCHLSFTARVGGDVHAFAFDETFSGG